MNFVFYLGPVLILSTLYSIVNALKTSSRLPSPFLNKIPHSLSIISIIFTVIATELGGSVLLGSSQEAYTVGLYGLLYIVGISIGLLLLSIYFASKMKAMNVSNTIDLFESKYNSAMLRLWASFLSTLTLCGLLIGQILAAKTLIQALGINHEYIFILFWSLALVYTLVGGYKAAGITYQAQLIYIIFIFSGTFMYCIFKEPPTFFNTLIGNKKLILDSSTMDFSTVFASLVMPALYYITDQGFAQPFFEIRSKRMRIGTALAASLFMIAFSLVPIYFGIKARCMNLSLPEGVSPLIPVLTILTNEYVVILAVCGIIAALIATIDSYLWSISYSIQHDLNYLFQGTATFEGAPKMLAFLTGILALAASYWVNSSIVQTITSSYELYDSCLIVPLLMSYFKTDLRKGAALGSILFGLFGFIFFRLVTVPFSGEIASLVLSLIGYILGGYLHNCWQRLPAIKPSRPCSI